MYIIVIMTPIDTNIYNKEIQLILFKNLIKKRVRLLNPTPTTDIIQKIKTHSLKQDALVHQFICYR